MEVVIAVLLIVVVAALLARALVRLVTIHDYERGLHYRNGRFVGLLDAGTHVAVTPWSEIRVIDIRPTILTVPGPEILTADGVALRVSLTARYVVADPVAAVSGDQSYVTALYTLLHGGLREAIAGRTADELLAARTELGPAVGGIVASELARIGVELLGVDVRDVMVPSELKRAFAGIVAARREGEAAVERARGETAALRSLANAGRLIEDNPGLLQLRILHQLAASSGNTVVLGWPGAEGAPLPAPASPGATGRSRPSRRGTAEG
ncbi:MAG TPA: slipin family protein [Candidatus Limnocylindrales bacterium]|nr:slipin family protein [Candidatus Limnocylindrales bacterium]